MLSTETKKKLGPVFTVLNRARLEYLRFRHKGDKVYCVCCKSSFERFAPFGAIRRNNAWCPKCESLERHRLLWMYFEKNTDLYKKPLRLLHIAPETIFFKHFKRQQNIDYYPADKFNMVYPAGTKYIDILNTALPDESFDVIICNHVFQYIDDDNAAMKELYRVLKKDGWAIMQVPVDKSLKRTYEDATITDPKEREKAFGLEEHVRYYGMDYTERLAAAGFDVRIDDYTAAFSEAENFKYGFWKGDPIFYCTK